MGFDVRIDNDYDWNSQDFSVQEDATPLDVSESTGGSGQITIHLPSQKAYRGLKNKQMTIEDTLYGTAQARISSTSTDGDIATITGDGRIFALTAVKTAQPFHGTLEGAFRYYLGLCGITTGIQIQTSFANKPVVFLGWHAPVLDQLKKLCSAFRVELAEVSKQIVLRDVRQNIAFNHRDSQVNWAEDDTSVVQNVEIYQYDTVWRTDHLAYPLNAFDYSVAIQQVGANEVVNVSLDLTPQQEDNALGASLASVKSPIPVAGSLLNPGSDPGFYAVYDKDDLEVDPALWTSAGGKVVAVLGEDTRTIEVTITGMANFDRAPYKLAMKNFNGEFVNGLTISGTGVFYARQLRKWGTGANPDLYHDESSATVDNEFVDGVDGLVTAFMSMRGKIGTSYNLSVDTDGINGVTTKHDLQYQTVRDFNRQYDGMTIADFNALWAGKTIADYNAETVALVSDRFKFQIFGNVIGSRVINEGSYYRITSSEINQEGVSYDAIDDNTVRDFNVHYAGMTIADFNAMWAGKKVSDFNLAPFQFSDLPDYSFNRPGTEFASSGTGDENAYGADGYGSGGYGT